MKIRKEQLLQWDKEGLIPGPCEKEEDFVKRVNFCLQARNQPTTILPLVSFVAKELFFSKQLLSEAFPKARLLFGIEPHWLPLFFSNAKLAPWHGAVAWIVQRDEASPTIAVLQLRKNFSNKKNYLHIYRREELIAHELAHVGRMMFEEEQFEEILAYRTATTPLRRWWGPIVQSSWEVLFFLLLLFTLSVFDFFLLATARYDLYTTALWLKLLPLGLATLGFQRLWRRQRILTRCFVQLKKVVQSEETANAIVYRLTDKEIIAFASMTPNEICHFVAQHKKSSLRWRLLAHYFLLDF